MLIGIMSDTHDDAKNLLKAVDIFNDKKVKTVFHCGDWVAPFMPDFCQNLKCKIISVFGNNEGDIYRFINNQDKWNIEFHKYTAEAKIGNKKIIAYHGDDKHLLNSLIESQKYDLVLSGHTHEILVETKGKTLHVNPGTVSNYSNSQIVDLPSVAIYDTISNQVEIIKIQ